MPTEECAVTDYSPWSVCSVTCGKGLRARTRSYLYPSVAQQAKCDRQLVSREMCVAEVPLCPWVYHKIQIFDTTFLDSVYWNDLQLIIIPASVKVSWLYDLKVITYQELIHVIHTTTIYIQNLQRVYKWNACTGDKLFHVFLLST